MNQAIPTFTHMPDCQAYRTREDQDCDCEPVDITGIPSELADAVATAERDRQWHDWLDGQGC